MRDQHHTWSIAVYAEFLKNRAARDTARAMSQENVEIVRHFFEAFGRGDLDATLDYIAPDMEFHTSGRFADTEPVYRGRQGWIDFWHNFQAPWESITVGMDRIEDLGDQVLVLGTFHGRGEGSGAEVSGQAAWLSKIESGMFVHTRAFAAWNEALEAAGLSE